MKMLNPFNWSFRGKVTAMTVITCVVIWMGIIEYTPKILKGLYSIFNYIVG